MSEFETSHLDGRQARSAKPRQNETGDRKIASSVLCFFLALLVVLIPLPFGGARPWAQALTGLWVALLMLGTALSLPADRTVVQKSLALPILAFTAVAAFILLQTSTLSPHSWHHDIWRVAEEYLGTTLPGAISLDPTTTYSGLTKWLSYAGVFCLAFMLHGGRERARFAVLIVAISGGVYAVYALVTYWSGNHYVLWFPKWTYNSDLSGPFVNRNSFSTFLGLSLLAVMALLFNDAARARPTKQLISPRRFDAIGIFVVDHVWLVMLLFVLLTALLLTHSRGGFLSTAVGAAAFIAMLQQTRNYFTVEKSQLMIPVLCFAVLALLISGERLFDRMATSDQDANGRITIYKAAIEEIRQNPLSGSGLGSFQSVFQLHRTQEFPLGEVTKAHSDYLETITELGAPAAMLLFLTIGWLMRICIRGAFARQRDGVWPCLGVGASALVAVHALFDFSLQIPAVAVTYFYLLGVAVAQSHSTRNSV